MSQGGRLHPRPDFLERLEQAWLWDGSALPPALQAAVRREEERWRLVDQQIRALEAEQAPRLEEAALPWHHQIAPLMPLRGIGLTSAWVFGMESFGWRQCTNRQEVAALAGLTPMPYASGDSYREQGMSKAGANAGCRGQTSRTMGKSRCATMATPSPVPGLGNSA